LQGAAQSFQILTIPGQTENLLLKKYTYICIATTIRIMPIQFCKPYHY